MTDVTPLDRLRELVHLARGTCLTPAQKEAEAQREYAAIRNEAFAEAAARLDRIADEVEAKVAAHYGLASGLGPGSADMVREAASTVRSLATATDGH